LTKTTKFCRMCGAQILRDSVFCESCGTSLTSAVSVEVHPEGSVESREETTNTFATAIRYSSSDVLQYLIEKMRHGRSFVIDASPNIHPNLKNIPGIRKLQETAGDLEPSYDGYRGRLSTGIFTVKHPIPYYWGRDKCITYSEIKGEPQVLSMLGVDNALAVKTLEGICRDLGVSNPEAKKAIKDRIDTIKHLHEYPTQYQERILFGEIIPKNYSLGTRIGGACMPVGFIVTSALLLRLSPSVLTSLFGLLIPVGVVIAFYVGAGIGSVLEKNAAGRGVIYRRNTKGWRVFPIPTT